MTNISENLEFLQKNETELIQMFESIKLEIGDKKMGEVTLYNVWEKCEPIIKINELKDFKIAIEKFSQISEVIREIEAKKNAIVGNFEFGKRLLSGLKMPVDFEIQMEELIRNEAILKNKQTKIENFQKHYFISDEELGEFMNEDVEINENFYRVFARILENIELQQSVINEDYLASGNKGDQSVKVVYENTFQIAKRLGMRKLNNCFDKTVIKLIFERREFFAMVDFLCLNNENSLAKINQKIMQLVANNLRQVLETQNLTGKKNVVQVYAQMSPAIDFCMEFVLSFTKQLFRKFSNAEIYFQSNVELIFETSLVFLQIGSQFFQQSRSLKVEALAIVESILRIRNVLKRNKPKSMNFSCEKVLDGMISDLAARFRILSGFHFEKLFAIKNVKNVREQVIFTLDNYSSILQHFMIARNQVFLEIIFENFNKSEEVFAGFEDWSEMKKKVLFKCCTDEIKKLAGKEFQKFVKLINEPQKVGISN